MTDALDFAEAFGGCTTVSDANSLYQTLFVQHCMVIGQPAGAAYAALILARDATIERLRGPRRSDGLRSHVLRNWCRQQGIPLAAKGRVPVEIENQYRETHDLPPRESARRPRSSTSSNAETPAIRAWARTQGISVGSRGRLHPDVIAQYRAAHP